MVGLDEWGHRRFIRLVLADSDPLAAAYFRQQIEAEPDLLLTGVARGISELRELLAEARPLLLVTEIELAGEPVLPVLTELLQVPEGPRVLVLTSDASTPRVLAAVAAGVRCYWLKEHALSGIADLIRRCAAAETVLDDKLTSIVLMGYQKLARHPPAAVPAGQPALSGRVIEVLGLMAAGLRNREIAQRLGLSEHTIKIYVGQLFAHLGVSDRTAAVMEAIRRGLVRPPVNSA